MFDFIKISSRALNKNQRNAVARIVEFYKDKESYNGVTSIRFEITRCDDFVSMSLRTRRNDCEKFSPRQLLTGRSGQFFIGKRGGIRVARAEQGLGNEEHRHIARMLHCSTI